jgi:hypothetical protein
MAGDWRRPASWLIGLSLVARSESVRDGSNSRSDNKQDSRRLRDSINPLNAFRFLFAALRQVRHVLLRAAALCPMDEQMQEMHTLLAMLT